MYSPEIIQSLTERIGFGSPQEDGFTLTISEAIQNGASGRTFKSFHSLVTLENIIAGIEKEQIEVSENALKRKFEIQKIITESGIEVKIPVNYYGDASKLEFIPNGDGSVSLVIKNIGNIQS